MAAPLIIIMPTQHVCCVDAVRAKRSNWAHHLHLIPFGAARARVRNGSEHACMAKLMASGSLAECGSACMMLTSGVGRCADSNVHHSCCGAHALDARAASHAAWGNFFLITDKCSAD